MVHFSGSECEWLRVVAKHGTNLGGVVMDQKGIDILREKIDISDMYQYGVRSFTMEDGWTYELQEIHPT